MLRNVQNLGSRGYEEKKAHVVDDIVQQLERYFPGLRDGIVFKYVS